MNVNLGPTLDRFIEDLLGTGTYQSRSEVVREGLRLLKEREEVKRLRLEEMRKEIAIGLEQVERGQVAPLDVEAVKAEGRRRLAETQKGRK